MLAASTVMVVASMGLSGCGSDNPAPKPSTPPKAPSVSVSGSSSADAVPQMPDEAKQNNAASAKAFVRYYFQVSSKALATGDVDVVDALASGQCESCAGMVDTIKSTYAKGGHFEGKGVSTSSLTVPYMTRRDASVHGEITLYPQSDYRSAGASPREVPAEHHDFEMTLKRVGTGWKVEQWAFVS